VSGLNEPDALAGRFDDESVRKAIGQRMALARETIKMSQTEFARFIGGSKSGIQDNEAGKNMPGGKVLAGFIRAGVNSNWILTNEGEMLLADMAARKTYDWSPDVTAKEPALPLYIDDGSVAIDKYINVNGSAGPGTDIHDEAIVKVRVDIRLLRERIGSNFGKIKIASVSGDSMEPTLSHGDQVLVDTSCTRFIDDAIYAIQQDGHLRFKRIQLKLDGSIVVKSDGTPHTETYNSEEAARFFVVGIVIPFKFGRFKV
jgi:phage repressor protein C with HTH and peptisase S24 domain